MRLLVASDDSGCIKEIVCNKGTNTSVQTAPQPFYVATHLAQGLANKVEKFVTMGDSLIVMARSGGSVELVKYSLQDQDETENLAEGSEEKPENKPQFKVMKFEVLSSISNLLDVSRLESLNKISTKRSKLHDEFVTLCKIPDTAEHLFVATKSGLIHIIKIEDDKLLKINTLSIKAPLEFAQLYDLSKGPYQKYLFAYGGEENLVKLVELSTDFTQLKQIWEAKNVKNDRLDLKVPIWPMRLIFLEPSTGPKPDNGKIDYQFITITRHSHLRKYQTLHGRKPIQSLDLLPNREPLTQLCASNTKELTPLGNIKHSQFEHFQFLTTDTRKSLYSFDSQGKMLGKFGPSDVTGYVSFVDAQCERYVVAGGFDRYVRVFDLHKRDLLCKVYTGAKVSFVKLLDEKDVELPDTDKKNKKKRKLTEEEEEEDAEELWGQLEKKKKKKKSVKQKD